MTCKRLTQKRAGFFSKLLLVICLLFPTGTSTKQTEQNDIISPEQAKEKLDHGDDVILLDVRTSMEYKWKHIPGAVHISRGDLEKRYGELDPEKEIIVYCHSGHRSAKAVTFLKEKGFSKVFDLSVGISGWPYDTE